MFLRRVRRGTPSGAGLGIGFDGAFGTSWGKMPNVAGDAQTVICFATRENCDLKLGRECGNREPIKSAANLLNTDPFFHKEGAKF